MSNSTGNEQDSLSSESNPSMETKEQQQGRGRVPVMNNSMAMAGTVTSALRQAGSPLKREQKGVRFDKEIGLFYTCAPDSQSMIAFPGESDNESIAATLGTATSRSPTSSETYCGSPPEDSLRLGESQYRVGKKRGRKSSNPLNSVREEEDVESMAQSLRRQLFEISQPLPVFERRKGNDEDTAVHDAEDTLSMLREISENTSDQSEPLPKIPKTTSTTATAVALRNIPGIDVVVEEDPVVRKLKQAKIVVDTPNSFSIQQFISQLKETVVEQPPE